MFLSFILGGGVLSFILEGGFYPLFGGGGGGFYPLFWGGGGGVLSFILGGGSKPIFKYKSFHLRIRYHTADECIIASYEIASATHLRTWYNTADKRAYC